jgi:hypothetical protein
MQENGARPQRRFVPAHIVAIGASPGIERLKNMALQDLEEHDRRGLFADNSRWQTWYSLTKHSTQVGHALKKISEEEDMSPRDTNLSYVASIHHDVGKTTKQCEIYRLLKVFNKKERALIDLHPMYSKDYISSQLKYSRAEDHPFLRDEMEIVLNHHKPWRIYVANLRNIAWKLKAVDIFISLQEKRWRPGLSQDEAVETFPIIMRAETPWVARIMFGKEINSSIKVITKLFGRARHRKGIIV